MVCLSSLGQLETALLRHYLFTCDIEHITKYAHLRNVQCQQMTLLKSHLKVNNLSLFFEGV